MKKRLSAFLLATVMMLGMLPTMTQAVQAATTMTSKQITDKITVYRAALGGDCVKYWNGLPDNKTTLLKAKLDSVGSISIPVDGLSDAEIRARLTTAQIAAFTFGTTTSRCVGARSSAGHGGGCSSNYFNGVALNFRIQNPNLIAENQTGGRQCSGFADYLMYLIYGTMDTSDFQLHTSSVPAGYEFKPGDFIRLNDYHSMVVYKVEGNKVYFAECNWGACSVSVKEEKNCRISFCRSWTQAELKAEMAKRPGSFAITPKTTLRKDGGDNVPGAKPAAPGGLSAKTESATSYTAKISWTAVAGATSYEVQYCTSANAEWQKDKDYKVNTDTWYISTGLRDRDWYDYRVRAVNQYGASAWSEPVRYTRDHVHSYTAAVTKPTCTAGGYTTHTCTCGASYKDSNTAALGHDYRNDKSAFAYVCTNCGDAYEKSPFADVTEQDWFYNAVEYVVTEGVMSGYSAGEFGPNDSLNRAMMVQLLYNKEGQPSQSGIKHGFSDVPVKQWFNNAVTWGSRRGIVSGFGGGLFKPEDAVTLEQIAVILWNYAGKPAASGRPAKAGLYNSWAANALSWCEDMDILDGVPFRNATEQATRAQAAQMLANYLG